MKNLIRATSAGVIALTLAMVNPILAHAAGLEVRWSASDSWTTSLSGDFFFNPGTAIQLLPPALTPSSLNGVTAATYRISPGSGLRGSFQVRNNSAEAARLGIFASKSASPLATKPDPMTADDNNVKIKMSDPTLWPGTLEASVDTCVVIAQRILAPGEEADVAVDAYMPWSTILGVSGEFTVTLPQINAALAPAASTAPYETCQPKVGPVTPYQTPIPPPSDSPADPPSANTVPAPQPSEPTVIRRAIILARTGGPPALVALLGLTCVLGVALVRRGNRRVERLGNKS